MVDTTRNIDVGNNSEKRKKCECVPYTCWSLIRKALQNYFKLTMPRSLVHEIDRGAAKNVFAFFYFF